MESLKGATTSGLRLVWQERQTPEAFSDWVTTLRVGEVAVLDAPRTDVTVTCTW